jgi:hypothetical protein
MAEVPTVKSKLPPPQSLTPALSQHLNSIVPNVMNNLQAAAAASSSATTASPAANNPVKSENGMIKNILTVKNRS